MPYSAKAVANMFLSLAKNDNETLSQIKLQKLVYISHGFNLAIRNAPLIDEDIEAWEYGPVIISLYNEFRGFGVDPISKEATEITINDNFDFIYEVPCVSDTYTKTLITTVWSKFKIYSGSNLSDLTHQIGTPWSDTPSQSIINSDTIRNHYLAMLGY